MYLIERGLGSYLLSGFTTISVNRPSWVQPLEFTMLPGFLLEATIWNGTFNVLMLILEHEWKVGWENDKITIGMTDRRSKAVSEFVGEGQLNVAWWEELSVVLNGDQTRVQGGGFTITQGHGLWAYPAPVTWKKKRWEDKSVVSACNSSP